MDKIDLNINRYTKLKKGRIFTPEQDLADQIYSWSGKKLNFAMVMKFIKTRGRQRIYDIYNSIRQADCDDPVALFMWRYKNDK